MITYIATNTKNGKFYVGSTNNFERRKKQHMECKKGYPFQNALRKNPEAFEWETWSDDSDEPNLEQALLDMWFGTEQCYNLSKDASAPMRGKKHTTESKQKIRRAKRGKKASLSDAGRKKLSEKMSGRNSPNFGQPGKFLGRKHSAETLEKLKGPKKTKAVRSEEHNRKIGESRKGLLWWVNREGEVKSSRESPGEEWQRGRVWKGNI